MVIYGGTLTWVVTMVDGIKDDGVVWDTIGVVEGEIEIALLLFG